MLKLQSSSWLSAILKSVSAMQGKAAKAQAKAEKEGEKDGHH